MNRYQRWGNKAEQLQEQVRYEKRPQHARVPFRILQCADCLRELSARHPAHLGDRCWSCWEALAELVELMECEGVGVYV